MPVAQVARVLSAVVVSAMAFAALSVSPSGAATNMPCTATIMSLPHSYNLVMINVATRPGAEVTATEIAGAHSWSMSPNASANASGRDRFSQRVAPIAKYALVRVTVSVNLDGLTGHCSTHFSPPTLTARL
jgi:hypothetical protein